MTEPSQTRSFYVPDKVVDDLDREAKARGVSRNQVAVARLSRRSFFVCLWAALFKKKGS